MPSSSASIWKKSLFSLRNNSILHNRVLLYFIFLVSLGNLFYLTVDRDITSIVVFLLVGLLTSFFSKNMLVILFIALVTSAVIKHGVGIRHEGLENMVDAPESDNYAEEPAQDENDLSNEMYLESEPKRKNRIEGYDGEDDEEEEAVIENYEDEKKSSENDADEKKTDKKKKYNDRLSACIRTCMDM